MSNKDHDYTPEEALALEAVGHASAMARNDPNYLADLEEQARDLASVANDTARVRLHEGPKGSTIEVEPQRPRHRPATRQMAFALGRLLEAEVQIVPAAPRAGHDHADATYRQPAQHTHYKDDRK